jgi:hypothetical protein
VWWHGCHADGIQSLILLTTPTIRGHARWSAGYEVWYKT